VNYVPISDNNFIASGPYSPPTISSTRATPSVVPGVGSSAILSVIASGSAPLTYSWDTLTARAPVSFSINDSISAASTVVTFQAPGSHTFRVRVTDSQSLSTTSTVSVTVSAGAGAIVVTPYEVQLSTGGTIAFRADAWDQLGNRVTVAPVWSVNGGGGINSNGLFTATTAGGPFSVIAVGGGSSATSSVWITSMDVPSPRLLITYLSNGSYRIRFDGVSGRTYRLEHTDGFAPVQWEALATGTADNNGICEFVDAPPVGTTRRFYRSAYP
jgi:hypothetical protein